MIDLERETDWKTRFPDCKQKEAAAVLRQKCGGHGCHTVLGRALRYFVEIGKGREIGQDVYVLIGMTADYWNEHGVFPRTDEDKSRRHKKKPCADKPTASDGGDALDTKTIDISAGDGRCVTINVNHGATLNLYFVK